MNTVRCSRANRPTTGQRPISALAVKTSGVIELKTGISIHEQ